MKKLLTIALSLVMVLSMTAVSFAYVTPETDENGNTVYVDESSVTITKTYEATNAGTTSPAETFTFSELDCVSVTDAAADVTAENAPVPEIADVTYAAGDAGSENATKEITITLPTYTSVGIYTYTFTEEAADTAGVTYYGDEITLVVTVIEQNGKIRVAAVHAESPVDPSYAENENDYNEDGTVNTAKTDKFENVYSAGSLTVGKEVTGLLGDKNKEFAITVKFAAPVVEVENEDGTTSTSALNVNSVITYTVTGDETVYTLDWTEATTDGITFDLSDGEYVTFVNVPYGVTYTVSEADYSEDGYTSVIDYDVDDITDPETSVDMKIDSASEKTVVTNTKGATIDTGIILDNGLYIVLLAGVAVAAGMFFMKRRQDEYDM